MQDGRMLWGGFDYTAAEIGIRNSGIEITPELWNGLRIMEGAARNCLNGVKVMDE